MVRTRGNRKMLGLRRGGAGFVWPLGISRLVGGGAGRLKDAQMALELGGDVHQHFAVDLHRRVRRQACLAIHMAASLELVKPLRKARTVLHAG